MTTETTWLRDLIAWAEGRPPYSQGRREDVIATAKLHASNGSEGMPDLCGHLWDRAVEDTDECPRCRLRDALEGMVQQFAYWSDGVGGYTTGGLSALEDAFEVLGWDDPHPEAGARCDEPGCLQQISCGTPTAEGYRRTCGDHRPEPDREGMARWRAADDTGTSA